MHEAFAKHKEAAIWGVLYGFQQERIDFHITYVKDAKTKETEVLTYRWWKNNPPKIKESSITCTLVFNTYPRFIEVFYSEIINIITESGMVTSFVSLEEDPDSLKVVEKPEKKPPPKQERKIGKLHVVK